jgi:hypothetical protein
MTELRIVNRSIPFNAGHPINKAKEAPAKPISDKVWVIKGIFLATTNTPITPLTTAINVLAMKAYRIKLRLNITDLLDRW